MSNLVSFATKIEAGAKFWIPVFAQNSIVGGYEVIITCVDESVYMTATLTGTTGIQSLDDFTENVEHGVYIEIL